jgi:AraC family transcriptional regulator
MTVQSNSKGVTISRAVLAQGRGWSVSDVTFRATSACSRFESRHESIAVVAVTAGSFRYRASHGCVTLMPGALMLGNAGDAFACDYDDTWGDRCVSFGYTPGYFERVAAGVTGARHARFHTHRVAATPGVIALTAEIEAERGRADADRWEELALRVAGDALSAAVHAAPAVPSARDERRVIGALDLIEARYAEPLSLGAIAGAVHMSPYHFLRVFRAVAGVTPHQYLVRTRLRRAAIALATTDQPVGDIAFAHGFGDLSTFVTTFRRVFGAAPRAYRTTRARPARLRIKSRA